MDAQRTLSELRKIYKEWNEKEPRVFEVQDALELFLTRSYSLGQHIKMQLRKEVRQESTKATKGKAKQAAPTDVDKFIKNSKYINFADDVAASFRHGGWKDEPKSGRQRPPSHQIVITINQTGASKSRYIFVSETEKHDALELAEGCMKEWNAFIADNGIVLEGPKPKKTAI